MVRLDYFVSSAEEEEGSCAISALGFALAQALVANQCSLLISNKSANGNAGKRPICDGAIIF